MATDLSYLLMTGASGLIGSQLLARLLRSHQPVCVLLRSKNERAARDRMDSILEPFENRWGQRLSRPAIVCGDLREPNAGLSDSDQAFVAGRCDSALHLAASLSFRPASSTPDNEPYRTNLEGTKRLLDLCHRTGVDVFHYVSTAYVCGTWTETFRECDLDLGQSFSNDYERSKLLTEQWLREESQLRSLTIYRPSIVIDTTGDSPLSTDRTMYVAYSMFKMINEKFGSLFQGNWFEFLGCSAEDRKNLVDADWVANVIGGIVQSPTLHGRTYNITSASGTSVEDVETAFKSSKKGASPVRTRPERVSIGKRLVQRSKQVITRQTRSIAETMAGPYLETFAPYFRNDPIFDRTNLSVALKTLGLVDQRPIGVAEITEFTRVQPIDATTPVKRSHGLLALRMQAEWIAFDNLVTSFDNDVRDADQSDDWGLMLIGSGGGDWRIRLDPFAICVGGQGCARSLYTDTRIWLGLMSAKLTLDNAIVSQQMTYEYDFDKHHMPQEHHLAEIRRLIEGCQSRIRWSGEVSR